MLLLLSVVAVVEAGKVSVVDSHSDCEDVQDCKLGPWSPWSECYGVCGGRRSVKERYRIIAQHHKCGGAICSPTTEMIQETECRGESCYNGGVLRNWTCECRPGYAGECCAQRINLRFNPTSSPAHQLTCNPLYGPDSCECDWFNDCDTVVSGVFWYCASHSVSGETRNKQEKYQRGPERTN
eukprot:sb/3471589/